MAGVRLRPRSRLFEGDGAGVSLDRGVDCLRAAERFAMIVHSERNRNAWVHDGSCIKLLPQEEGVDCSKGNNTVRVGWKLANCPNIQALRFEIFSRYD